MHTLQCQLACSVCLLSVSPTTYYLLPITHYLLPTTTYYFLLTLTAHHSLTGVRLLPA